MTTTKVEMIGRDHYFDQGRLLCRVATEYRMVVR